MVNCDWFTKQIQRMLPFCAPSFAASICASSFVFCSLFSVLKVKCSPSRVRLKCLHTQRIVTGRRLQSLCHLKFHLLICFVKEKTTLAPVDPEILPLSAVCTVVLWSPEPFHLHCTSKCTHLSNAGLNFVKPRLSMKVFTWKTGEQNKLNSHQITQNLSNSNTARSEALLGFRRHLINSHLLVLWVRFRNPLALLRIPHHLNHAGLAKAPNLAENRKSVPVYEGTLFPPSKHDKNT